MKQQIRLWTAALILALLCTLVFTGCSVPGGNQDGENTDPTDPAVVTLAAPVATLNSDNSVTWNEVEGATGYIVNVNGSDLNTTTSTTFAAMAAAGTYEIKVQATDGANKSEYSNTVSYSIVSVKLPTSELYTIKGETLVVGGMDYTFTLAIGEGVIGTPVVKANGTVIEGTEGTYTIAAISENTVITVEGIKKQQTYTVTLPESPIGYTITGADSVKETENYTFTIAINPNCTQSTPTVKVNGEVITGTEGTYTVENVSENLVITVEGIEINKYSVTLPTETEGYTVTGNTEVGEGDNYSFTVTLDAAYSESEITVKINGTSVSAGDDGKYTVTNVTADITVTVEGVAKNTYKVTLTEGAGYTITPAGEQTVSYGESLSFTVSCEAPFAVFVNGEVLTAVEGTYTISNVTAAATVEVVVRGTVDSLLSVSSWTTGEYTENKDSLVLSANSSISAAYFEKLWNAGYTHLVFTVNGDSLTNYTHGGAWERYWRNLTGGQDNVIRVDLNEFHDDDTWYNLNFSAGEMTVSNVKAYKSAETLEWTKTGVGTPSNVYFAIEDGYYVLETITNQGVISPTEWLEKYCVKDNASQRSWRVYTDYITVGSNNRSILWGWGSAVNCISESTDAGWYWLNGMQTDGYTEGEVFSLHTDIGGTARFKISDMVSNRNSDNASLGLEDLGNGTYIWSGAADYKIRYAATQELIRAGYTKLIVTLKGDLGSAMIWWGNDNWTPGEQGVDADKFVDGVYSIELDLTATSGETFNNGENLTFMLSGGSVTNLEITVIPDEATKGDPLTQYTVTVPESSDYTVTGSASQTVWSGESASFTITADAGKVIVVKVGDTEITASGSVYTVTNVTSDITLTVTVEDYVAPDSGEDSDADTTVDATVAALLTADAWSAGGTESANNIVVPANSQITADYLKSLWDAGYTHLVFTVNAVAGGDNAFMHGGTWDRYWKNITANTDQDIRIDLDEFHDDDTWYSLNFSIGEMTVSNVRAYKSAETLEWAKSSTNIYFAIEDGYYVLETRANGAYVTSPTKWLEKYCVADDVSQRSWLVYTDYITVGNNTRSILWGWGSAVNCISESTDAGWYWLNGMQTDGYTEGEVFSLHTDSSATARFKISDMVSNRRGDNEALGLDDLGNGTYVWSGENGYRLRLATTQELIAAGYTKLIVTFKGDLGSTVIYYGNGDWSTDAGSELYVSAADFTDGACTVEIDITAFGSGECFTLMGNGVSFSDIEITITTANGDITVGTPLITLQSDNSITWAKVDGATGYIIEINGVAGEITAYTGLDAFTEAGTYTVRVKAVNGETEGEYSNQVSYTVQTTVAALQAPVLTLCSDNSITWSEVDGATGYIVEVNGISGSVTTSTTVGAYETMGEYTIRVKAIGETNSPWSEAVSYSVEDIVLSDLGDSVCLVNDPQRAYLEATSGSSEELITNTALGYVDVCYGVEIKWSDNYTGATSYTVIYSTAEDFSNSMTVSAQAGASSVKLVNLLKDTTYYYKVVVNGADGTIAEKQSSFTTWNIGPRVIEVDGIYNVRDIGGYMTESGKLTLQGLLYRGSEMNGLHDIFITQSGIYTMVNELGIVSDVDLRGAGEGDGATESPLGSDVNFAYYAAGSYLEAFTDSEPYRKVLSLLADESNYPVYFHCWGGADRTGTVAFLVNALCGVSLEDLIHDYEFTSYSIFGTRSYEAQMKPVYDKLMADFEGDTLSEKTANFMLSIGLTETEIYNIKAIMFGEPTIESDGESDENVIELTDIVPAGTVLDSSNLSLESGVIGYGTTVTGVIKTTMGTANGGVEFTIGSYGFYLRGDVFRVYLNGREVSRSTAYACDTNAFDNGDLRFSIKVEIIDETTARLSIVTELVDGSNGDTEVNYYYDFTIADSDITSENATFKLRINSGDVTSCEIIED